MAHHEEQLLSQIVRTATRIANGNPGFARWIAEGDGDDISIVVGGEQFYLYDPEGDGPSPPPPRILKEGMNRNKAMAIMAVVVATAAALGMNTATPALVLAVIELISQFISDDDE